MPPEPGSSPGTSAPLGLPKGLLFDMDGTLIDSEPLWLAAEMQTMARMGCLWGTADQAQCLGGPMSRVVKYMRSRIPADRREQFDEAIIGEWLLISVAERYENAPMIWMPGARELIVDARDQGVPMALVTNSPRVVVRAVLRGMIRDLGLTPFTCELVGDEVDNPKPHPDPFRLAAKAIGAIPEECLAIEDSPTGVSAALASGCKVIAVPHLAPLESTPGVTLVKTLLGQSTATLWEVASRSTALQ